ncbi:PKD domain-containing protein [Actinomadura sp. ATCC 39365]
MADTHGFEVVVEAGAAVLRKALIGAWKSAECGGTATGDGRIPQYLPIPPGVAIGTYVTAGGQVELPRDQLDATTEPAVDGARLTLGLIIQVLVADPPVPSAGLLDLTAAARVEAPIGVLPGSKNVGIRFDALARERVSATVTGGDPIEGKLLTVLQEYVHFAYENGGPDGTVHPGIPALPWTQDETDQALSFGIGGYTVDTHLEIYDDQKDAARAITVSRPDPATVLFSLPVYLRVFNIRRSGAAPPLATPMGVETRLEIRVPLERPPGSCTLRFDTATCTAGVIIPTPRFGIEGANYTANNATLFNLLEGALRTQLGQRGTALVRAFGARSIAAPTVADLERTLGDLIHADLAARRFVGLWTPEASGEVFDARDVATRVPADYLVIAINSAPGADIAAMPAFIPDGMEFAVALTGSLVRQNIDKARRDNGWADSDLPRRVDQDGTAADVRSLDIDLVDGAIRMTGELTVIDAILGSIDVDADFRADVGLHWNPDGALNPDGVQQMDNHLIGDPDVDPEESVAFWIIAVILAIITWGAGSILIAIVIIVAAAIITAIASGIGSSMAIDPITGAVTGITGWPPELARIGRVRAIFHDPIVIAADGLVIAGTMDVLSSCEQTQVLAARSGGPYFGTAQSALTLAAASTTPVAAYTWNPGDGTPPAATRDLSHVYPASGVYLAAHTLAITEPGGAASAHYTLVHVANVPPVADAGPDITLDEGRQVTLVGHFSDVEPADTHTTLWNFGDDQPTETGTISGTSTTVTHAWCDNGVYTVTLQVRDQNGGMDTDTRTVTVRNVPPVVVAGPALFAYPCSVITLSAAFTDQGWCDTHAATWEFGDCTAAIPATVTETHEPPAGRGTAVASHVYRRCGTYLARCVVTDDDGGVAEDTLVVQVTDVVNGHFEGGFARRRSGEVANGWEPYRTGTHLATGFVVHSGRRAQGIRAERGRAGIHQRVGANPGWAYQLTAWYDLEESRPAAARLGVDPTGGTDPDHPAVSWSEGVVADRWTPLTVRVTAAARAITVFLETRDGIAWFDDVELLAVQPFCPEAAEPPEPREVCLDFSHRGRDESFPATWTESGFRLSAPDGAGRHITGFAAGTALFLGPGLAAWPAVPAIRVTVTLAHQGGRDITLTARGPGGAVLDSAQVTAAHPAAPVTVTLTGPGIAVVEIEGEAAEGVLIRVCALIPAEGRDG